MWLPKAIIEKKITFIQLYLKCKKIIYLNFFLIGGFQVWIVVTRIQMWCGHPMLLVQPLNNIPCYIETLWTFQKTCFSHTCPEAPKFEISLIHHFSWCALPLQAFFLKVEIAASPNYTYVFFLCNVPFHKPNTKLIVGDVRGAEDLPIRLQQFLFSVKM